MSPFPPPAHAEVAPPRTDQDEVPPAPRRRVVEERGYPGRADRENVRARASVTLLFLLMGMTVGSWSSRVPDVQAAVRLDDMAWGFANMVTTAGSLTSLTVVAVLIGRVGPRRLALLGAIGLLINAPLLASADSVAALLAGMLAWGLATNLLATPINAQAVVVERRYGRPILSSFHAGFSVGLLTGGVLGTLAASAGVPPGVQLGCGSVVLGILLAVTRGWLPSDDPVGARPDRPRDRRQRLADRFSPQLLLLAGIAFLASFTQGAANQWSAIYTSQALSAGAVAGALTFTSTAVAETIARFGGDRLVARIGRIRFIRLSTTVAAGGVAVAVIGGTPAAAWIGFGLLGLGMGCVLPIVYGIAGDQPRLTPGEGISVAVLGQWPAFLIAPALIGSLSGLIGLRRALLLLACSALAASLLAARVRLPGARTGAAGRAVRPRP